MSLQPGEPATPPRLTQSRKGDSWAQKSPQCCPMLLCQCPQVVEKYGAGGGNRTRDLGIMRPRRGCPDRREKAGENGRNWRKITTYLFWPERPFKVLWPHSHESWSQNSPQVPTPTLVLTSF